jgi:hypothetical protein
MPLSWSRFGFPTALAVLLCKAAEGQSRSTSLKRGSWKTPTLFFVPIRSVPVYLRFENANTSKCLTMIWLRMKTMILLSPRETAYRLCPSDRSTCDTVYAGM